VELQPDGGDGLEVTLTGRGSPRQALAAIKATTNRGWESYKSIERYMGDGERCRRRQILDYFGDEEQGMPSGRCCDVCDPDSALAGAVSAPVARAQRKRAVRRAGRASGERAGEPVDEGQFERLRAWRMSRAEGLPAFRVASNVVLEEVLRVGPNDMGELLGVPGIGVAFCEQHGESLLQELRAL